ncbi:hypothetical protein [Flexivirga alba]|uniref:Tox-PL domain-containing protein n=1 Tax=Flexivirga alba TaxID=702742 RepID=A0ABW2AFU8_9MICO
MTEPVRRRTPAPQTTAAPAIPAPAPQPVRPVRGGPVRRFATDAGPTDAGVGPTDAGVGPTDAGAGPAAIPDTAGGVADRPDLSPPGAASGPPAAVAVDGVQLPEDDAGLLALVDGLVQGQGLGAVYRYTELLQSQLAAIDEEITGAHRFADAVANGYHQAAGVPWSEQMFVDRGADRAHLAHVADALERQLQVVLGRYQAFQQLVLQSGLLRLDGNRSALAQWKDYLHTELTPGQLQRQVQTEQQRSTIATATAGPMPSMALEALERQSTMTSARQRGVEDRVARGLIHGGCEYCHEMQHAINTDYAHPDLADGSTSPAQLFRQYASAEGGNPTPLPGFLTATPQTGIDPYAVAPYPRVASELQAIERVRPILRQLGPDGFKVIDIDTGYAGLDYTQLLTTLDSAIETRRTNFALLQNEIRTGHVDFLVLRPVLRELLPLADPTVHALIEQRIAQEASDSAVESIIIGVATVAALLLTIFPPTAPLGLALDVALGTYGIVSGIEQYQQGELLSLGVGSSVLDAEQQEAAHALMTMGALNIVLSAVGIGMAGLGAVRMIRSGTGATAVLEGAQAQAGGTRITISELNSSNPRALVVAEDGTVIADQSLTELSLLEGPATPGAGRSGQNVLVVGAETEGEFAYAEQVAGAGQPVTVVNPTRTPQSEAFAARGGNFVEAPIESLPAEPAYTMIREDFPFPLGRVLAPTEQFAAARLARLTPGGRWVVITESSEFATTLEAAASRQGARVTVREVPAAHEGAPASGWPRDPQRFVLIIENGPTTYTPGVPPATSSPALLSGEVLAPGGVLRPPADVLDAAIDALDAENPFSLGIGQRRAAQIESGARDFALDRPVGFDIDEPLPVGGDASPARAVQRAMDPHNRQLLDPATNQLTKYLGVSPETVLRSRMSLAPVSVVDNPNVLFTRRFDEITEMAEIFDEATRRVQNIRSLAPGAIKTRINANIRQIIGEGLTPAGARVRDALRTLGYEYVPGRGIVAVRGLTPFVPMTPLPPAVP